MLILQVISPTSRPKKNKKKRKRKPYGNPGSSFEATAEGPNGPEIVDFNDYGVGKPVFKVNYFFSLVKFE